METILKIEDLTKSYFRKRALNSINLELKKGKILGLLGPNGSGKTTLMKIATGIIKPTSGSILIDGKEIGKDTKAIVSYLPDVNYLYKWMSIKDAVDFFNDFYNDFDKEKVNKLLEFMELKQDLKVKELSKGMAEKLSLALVFARNAKLYILDEPLGGIDIKAREKIIDTILQSYSQESSIIISTHLVSDVERMFDEVAFIKDGEILLYENAEELRAEKGKSIEQIYREVF